MKVNISERYGSDGKQKKKWIVITNLDLNVNKNNVAMAFGDLGKGDMVLKPMHVYTILISADGMTLDGVQEVSAGTWIRQEWWCVPIDKT